jgi:hypothetical protein
VASKRTPMPLDWCGPACECCPHTTQGEMQQDRLLRDAWERCPESGCLVTICPRCEAERSAP